MAKHLEQHQVPDGMVANVPWGQPLERWSDRMVERGANYLAGNLDKGPDGEGLTFFPHLLDSLLEEADKRGLVIEVG